jgi:hypothetical protein
MTAFYFNPRGGLCNRWRAYLSAIGTCVKHGCQLKFWWPRQEHCHASYACLWKTCFGAEVDEKEWKGVLSYPIWDINNTSWLEYPAVRYSSLSYFNPPGAPPASELAANYMQPADAVQGLIDQFEAAHCRGTWEDWAAVIVRLGPTAHPKTKACSPLGWFKEQIRNLPPDRRVFLLADNAATHDELTAFDPRVASVPRSSFHIQHVETYIEAVASLYLAAKMPLVIGSYWSSMAEMPQMLNPRVMTLCHTSQNQF